MTEFDTSDLDVFLSEFARTVKCATWATSVEAIFDESAEYYDEGALVQPSLSMRASDVPSTAAEGDQFVFVHPVSQQEVTYRLVDTEKVDVGMTRIILRL